RLAALEEQVRVLAGQQGSGAAGQETAGQRGSKAAGHPTAFAPVQTAAPPRGPAALPSTAPPPAAPPPPFFHPSNGSANASSSPWEWWR
ncbi:MAG TPA: hypothetical protein VKB22_12775, partial [Gemmatimonadales bacterium]|nr:hypothetical protein [Gemmatimonadales bacterium]